MTWHIENSIPVTQPYLPPLTEFLPYLEKIWDNAWLTNNGPFHRQLEEELARYLGINHLSLFTNGTLALITALQALNIGGEVITTPYSFVATSHSLIWNNITPIFADIDPITLNINPEKIEALITEKTTAILAVHVYGNPCDTKSIQNIAEKHNLRVIYDAAHAFNIRHNEEPILRAGDLSILSFHATKVFNTFEGGAIVCHDTETKNHIDQLKNFGLVDEITMVQPGINAKMSEIQAAFGLLQLQYISDAIEKRKLIHNRYLDELSNIPGLRLPQWPNSVSNNYGYFPIFITDEFPIKRDDLYNKFREYNIFARRYFFPLISNFAPYHNHPSSQIENLPIANAIADQVLCIPIYPTLSEENQSLIISIIKDAATSCSMTEVKS